MYHFNVHRSTHCCAIYELVGLSGQVIDEKFVDAVKDKAKRAGQPHVLPLLIQFSDAEELGNGKRLRDVLVGLGYRCDEYSLGTNPKSGGNHVKLFHWYPNKNKKISMVREYVYESKEAGDNKLGAAQGRGVSVQTRRTGVGFLRTKRRTGAGL